MPMYDLIECSDNYSKTSGSSEQYYRNEPVLNNDAIVHFNANDNSTSFRFKLKIIGKTGSNSTKDVEIMVPLKYLSNFRRTLEMPLFEIVKLTLF